ncbi:MAG TPA: hypothetical protein VH143_30750 [Kofleriaceae bacterium]|nr:hypothetical protein [Kofleriaceae bacterium]
MSSNADESFLAELAAALRRVRLEAIVVGNVASILAGAPVLTQDVDLLVRDTPPNRRKLIKLAEAIGGVGPESISELTSTERIYGAAVPVDILYDRLIGGLTFASIRSRAREERVGRETLVVASLEDVIKSKTAAGRAKDRAALPILNDTLAVRRALAKKP